MDPAPICLFVYNRLDETIKTVKALKENYLSAKSKLFVFADGPKTSADESKVISVRNYLNSVSGFDSVRINESKKNLGLADSIINGVNEIFNRFDRVIVLEDDLITSRNFLDFMNQALEFYGGSNDIYSISGYTMDLPSLEDYPNDFYLGYRASSWGWGTWKKQWEMVDWNVTDYQNFKWNILRQLEFMRGGSDLPYMLQKQMNGKIDSWAVRWCYDQYKKDMYTIFPTTSKVMSIGFGDNATHTKYTNRFDTPLDSGNKRNFEFESKPAIDDVLAKEFRDKFSFKNRLLEKITQ